MLADDQLALLTSSVVSHGALCRLRVINALLMMAVGVWDVAHFFATHVAASCIGAACVDSPLRYFGFLSRWTLILVIVYLCIAAAGSCHLPSAEPAATRRWCTRLRTLHNVALPASLAVVPLYWGQLWVPEYAGRAIPPSQYFVHGYNCLAMLADFYLVRRTWAFRDGLVPTASFGLLNMAFMAAYYFGCRCPDGAACNLDAEGHAYVYSVVDWGRPREAAAVCLAAIAGPVPVLSAALAALSRRWRGDGHLARSPSTQGLSSAGAAARSRCQPPCQPPALPVSPDTVIGNFAPN